MRRLDDKSRMSGDVPVRICERLGVRFPRATRRNVYVRTQRSGPRVMVGITAFLEQRLKLKVNAEKSAVARPWQRKFLGYRVTWHKKPKLKIAPSSRPRFAEKIRQTLRGAGGQSLKQVIDPAQAGHAA